MNILVAGGTGFLGQTITNRLLGEGHRVAVLSRAAHATDSARPQLSWVQGDATDPASLLGKLGGFDVLVDAVQFPNSPIENPRKGYTFERVDLGGTKNLVDAAKAQGIGHFIGISGAGSAADAPYFWQRLKWQEEQHIAGSGVPYTIFRPSWVYGPGDVSLNRFLGFARFLPFIPVIGNGKTRINPLFVNDLAAHIAAAIALSAAKNGLFEIGGPSVMTMDEIIRAALAGAGKRRFLFHQPKPLMKLVAGVAQHLPGRPLTPDAIDFITMEGISDTTTLRATFGLPLTPLADGLATYLSAGASGRPVQAL